MLNGETTFWLTCTLFLVTYLGLALGKIPGLHMDRAGIALVGATLMLVTGMVTFDQAISPEAIDYKTLALLFGMMVVVGFMRLSGFFLRVAAWALWCIRTPLGLLGATIALSGLLSAFLINDIVCLTLTPLVLHLARRLRFDPIPHLIALATAANIGSTGTITGNPQNIYIGSHSGIPYLRFAARLLPVAGLGLLLNFLIVAFVYRRRLFSSGSNGLQIADCRLQNEKTSPESNHAEEAAMPCGDGWLQYKSVAVGLITVVLFFTGLPLELSALGAAAVLLVGRVDPRKVYAQIDWSLLVMFTGLFIVVHAFRLHVVAYWDIEHCQWLLGRPVDVLSAVSAGLSNLVSNVPAVLLMEPVLQAIPAPSQETAWLALAMSSTFAGNLTVLGSVANLIVVENASRQGVHVSFWEYCKVGIPLTVATLALGIVWLELVHY
jgi:Na+/H+ antiporter NhaD/arsenite permease-like protein